MRKPTPFFFTHLAGVFFNLVTSTVAFGNGNSMPCGLGASKTGDAVHVKACADDIKKNLSSKGGCGTPASTANGIQQIKNLIAADEKKGGAAKETFVEPTSQSSNSITYKFPERTMKPGESLYFAVPEHLQNRPVSFVILGHRQDPSLEAPASQKTNKNWDEKPGLTSVQVHGKNFSADKAWRFWNGMSSGDKGAKFAEARHELEMENLYEWQKYGSTGADSNDHSKTPVLVDGVKVVSVGADDVKVGELTVRFSPPDPKIKVEGLFTPGTSFGKSVGENAELGGGQKTGGKFPGAIPLGMASETSQSLPEGWKIINGNMLSIPIPKGKILSSVEVLGGDSHPDGITNKDGGMGTPGWAKASIGIQSGDNIEWMVKNENVPPEGIITGTPNDCNRVVQDGERIIIRGAQDIYYLMGVRIGLQ